MTALIVAASIVIWGALVVVAGLYEGRGRHLGLVRTFYALGAALCALNAVVDPSWWRTPVNGVAAYLYVRWYNRASDRHDFEKITREMTP